MENLQCATLKSLMLGMLNTSVGAAKAANKALYQQTPSIMAGPAWMLPLKFKQYLNVQ